jgi:predicted glycoside hydrolase/deacetylase ChbG (UPF0249 family)
MKRLIVNADDYGRTQEISRGIRQAHLRGIVTSTTCMMNIPTTAEDIALARKETPSLGLGVHLVLTMGRPVLALGSGSPLTDTNGNFLRQTELLRQLPHLQMEQVEREWRAHIEAFIDATGCTPTHLDSHHHSSYFSPELFRAMLELANEYKCAIRFPFAGDNSRELEETYKHVPELMKEFNVRHPDRFIADFYDERATYEELLNAIDRLPGGTTEIMCHPGYVDDALQTESAYHRQRERELEILTDPSIQDAIRANDIELITFAEL